MMYAIIVLLAGGLFFLAGCRPEGGEMSQQMLDELARSNAEVVTLTTVAGSLGTVLVVLAACLAFAIYLNRKGGGNG